MPQTVKISTFIRVMEAEGYVIEEQYIVPSVSTNSNQHFLLPPQSSLMNSATHRLQQALLITLPACPEESMHSFVMNVCTILDEWKSCTCLVQNPLEKF